MYQESKTSTRRREIRDKMLMRTFPRKTERFKNNERRSVDTKIKKMKNEKRDETFEREGRGEEEQKQV